MSAGYPPAPDTRPCEALQRLSAGRPRRRSGPYLGPRRERLERDDIQSGERLRVMMDAARRAVIEMKEHL
jgi:hypothetical protein